MKYILLCFVALTCVGCGRDPNRTPVKQVFVHKYGIEMEQKDWEERGRHGEVVTTRKDGVIVRQSYDNGKLHGETTLTFPYSSTLARLEDFEHGRLVREQDNYRSGIPQKEVLYKGHNQKVTTCWYEDGTPVSVELVQGGLLFSGEYFDSNHALEAQVKNGEGKRLVRESHHVSAEDLIVAGRMVKRTAYFESGEPKSITSYVNGQIHGERLTYFEAGLPNAVETWVNGELHGNLITFSGGEKLSERPYVHGMRQGLELVYGPKGEVTEEISWNDDVRHGPTRYLAEGEEQTVDWYYEGKNVRQHTYERLSLQYAQG